MNAWDLLTADEKTTVIEYARIELECYEDDPGDEPERRLEDAADIDRLSAAIHTLAMGRRIKNDHDRERLVRSALEGGTR